MIPISNPNILGSPSNPKVHLRARDRNRDFSQRASTENMAPSATLPIRATDSVDADTSRPRNEKPLKKSGVLDAAFAYDELTPAIGREYPKANIVDDLLNAPNSDQLLRDLAITSEYQRAPVVGRPVGRLRSRRLTRSARWNP